MNNFLAQFKPEIVDPKSNKIFCILEGKDELLFIKRLYELSFKNIDCKDFIKNKIKLQWGKDTIWENKSNCNFQGGNLKGCKTPNGVLEALYNSNYRIYAGLIIMFDKDCDVGDEVKKEVENILKDKYDYICFVSNPCFEKEILIIVKNDITKDYIQNNYQVINGSQCKWYKQNFSKIPKKDKYKSYQKCEKIIKNLDQKEIEISIFANTVQNFVKEKLK